MKPKTIYISGRMTGLSDFNFPAFFRAEERLQARGYKTINPARNQVQNTWHDYLRLDIKNMMSADAIYLLNGWEASKGSRIEFWLASQLDFEILYEQPAAIARALEEMIGDQTAAIPQAIKRVEETNER